jgi:hypothetical protein
MEGLKDALDRITLGFMLHGVLQTAIEFGLGSEEARAALANQASTLASHVDKQLVNGLQKFQ